MENLDFDVEGVSDRGRVYGYVERSRLGDGPCRKYMKVLHPSEMIAESAPLADLLSVLHDSPRMFVLNSNQVTDIVTRGDLQKAPVRMLLFGLVTLLEMHFLRIIRNHYPNDSWQSLLDANQLRLARNLQSKRRNRNEALDLADCLALECKIKIALEIPEIRERIKEKFENPAALLQSICDLRNRVAHAHDLTEGSSWAEVIDLGKKTEGLLELFEQLE
jgi:hypothetical protein